jgi:hypothetical protein
MKRILLLSVACLSIEASSAQWINSLSVQPAAPTSADTIRVYADVSFPSGGCDDKMVNQSITGNVINASALHCLGQLTFICTTTDTFTILPLPAGNYTFIYQVDAGGGPSPCTPGIVPGPSDSISFTVTTSSSIPEFSGSFQFDVFPTPAKDELTVSISTLPPDDAHLEIVDVTGKIVVRQKMMVHEMTISLEYMAAGTYVARIVQPSRIITEKKFTVIR